MQDRMRKYGQSCLDKIKTSLTDEFNLLFSQLDALQKQEVAQTARITELEEIC